jgi:methionine aminopeptidase
MLKPQGKPMPPLMLSQYAQKNIKPGQTLTEIAEGIEDSVRALTGHSGLEREAHATLDVITFLQTRVTCQSAH